MKKNIKESSLPKGKKQVKNKGKHKKKILRALVYIVLVVFVLSLIFLIGYGVYYIRTSSKFTVNKVQFKNNKIYTIEQLTGAAKVELGKNLYSLSSKNIEKNLKELPYVESIKISKKAPDTIVIAVNEYVSKYMAYNKERDEYIRLTSAGIILEKTDGESIKENELPLFGISFDDEIKLKSSIAQTELQKLKLYEKVNKAYSDEKITKKITSVEFKEKLIIITLDYDINVILEDDDLDYKMGFLNSILGKIGSKAGTIDMTLAEVIFTEKVK